MLESGYTVLQRIWISWANSVIGRTVVVQDCSDHILGQDNSSPSVACPNLRSRRCPAPASIESKMVSVQIVPQTLFVADDLAPLNCNRYPPRRGGAGSEPQDYSPDGEGCGSRPFTRSTHRAIELPRFVIYSLVPTLACITTVALNGVRNRNPPAFVDRLNSPTR